MSVTISRILHAGYVFKSEDTLIAFDPLFENPFSRNCYAFPNVNFDIEQIEKTKFSAVFISHFHDDHCSFESLDLLNRDTPIYMFCVFEEMFSLIKELGFTNVNSLDLGIKIQVGPFAITPLRALDADVDSIFHIEVQKLNILNVVDSWIDKFTLNRLALSAPWDLVLWPFQTMREIEVLSPSRAAPAPENLPTEWIEQLRILKPRYLVPSSCQFIQENWSWYNRAFFPITYKQFEKEMNAAIPNSQVLRLNPGISVVLNNESLQPASRLTWIEPIGNQNVDYQFEPQLKAPSTNVIAKHFSELKDSQKELVIKYLRVGLIKKFRTLEPTSDPYFQSTLYWRLLVFDHTGSETVFDYRIRGQNIELLNDTSSLTFDLNIKDFANLTLKEKGNFLIQGQPVSWLTEIPIAKLYAALELGEALTSLYIRINDGIFQDEIEKDIQLVEVVEDPLIRCLYTGVFGTYQKAQLKRLQNKKF